MSWSVSAIGKTPAVATEIAQQFGTYKCAEPEETVRQAALVLINSALSAQDPSTVVRVSAAGSQGLNYTTKAVYNQVTVTIEPQYGFVE